MPYRDKEKQRAAMREIIRRHREREKARMLELERHNKELEQQLTFKSDKPTIPDSRDEKIREQEQTIKEKNRQIEILGELLWELAQIPKTIPRPRPEILVRRDDGKTRS
jgi:uncharacterized protein YpbB